MTKKRMNKMDPARLTVSEKPSQLSMDPWMREALKNELVLLEMLKKVMFEGMIRMCRARLVKQESQ